MKARKPPHPRIAAHTEVPDVRRGPESTQEHVDADSFPAQ